MSQIGKKENMAVIPKRMEANKMNPMISWHSNFKKGAYIPPEAAK